MTKYIATNTFDKNKHKNEFNYFHTFPSFFCKKLLGKGTFSVAVVLRAEFASLSSTVFGFLLGAFTSTTQPTAFRCVLILK